MANPEQLEMLKQGVEKWSEWRDANAGVYVDLRDADLRGAKLAGARLSRADLRRANLSTANVSGARLHDADLSGANLARAILSGAYLRTANLSGANLHEADVRGSDLSGANLIQADLRRAYLGGVYLRDADLCRSDLRGTRLAAADLSGANLNHARLSGADLTRTRLGGVDFTDADLSAADLSGADLVGAQLRRATCVSATFTKAQFVETNLEGADLTGCRIYGISVWDVEVTGTVQRDLIITPGDAPSTITVDDLEVAQFIYLLLHNERIRKVIDTITSKVVLILGRFAAERKAVLDGIREELRNRNYLPVLFDFEKPSSQSTMETVSTLAHMARFLIADLTDAKSVLQELRGIVPSRPSLPVQPILLAGQAEPGMFDFFRNFPWVLETRYYASQGELLASLAERVIEPAERRLAAERGGVGTS